MIPFEWFHTLGAGAKVLVLDTGCDDPHVEAEHFTPASRRDPMRHGSMVCRSIASRDPATFGMAPFCTLRVAGTITNYKGLEAALEWGLEWKADVVTMSLGWAPHTDGIFEKLRLLDEQGAICLAAHSPFLKYPHSLPYVLAVGSIDDPAYKGLRTLAVTHRTKQDGPGKPWRGTSVATAMMAGVAACAKSYDPEIRREGFLTQVGLDPGPIAR